jgi:Spy/CpxP family protein refolding chaperone
MASVFNRSEALAMKSWIKRTLVGLLGAGVLVGGLAACSHRSPAPWSAEASATEQAEWRDRMVKRAARKLGRDTAQKAKLATLVDTLVAQRKAMAGDSASPRAEMQALVSGTQFDRARAQTLVFNKTDALREASPAVIAATADFYDSLQPAQQEQVREMLSRRGHRHGWRG